MTASAIDLLRVSRVVPATPDRVFRAWTTPDDVKQWFGRPDGYHIAGVEMDVRIGGNYRIEIAGSAFVGVILGTYREVVPSQRLVFTFTWEEAAIDAMDVGETLVTVEFKASNGGTEVVLVHERLREPATVMFHQFGWTNGFDRLEGFLSDGG